MDWYSPYLTISHHVANVSTLLEELCSRESMSLTPGCQGAPEKSPQVGARIGCRFFIRENGTSKMEGLTEVSWLQAAPGSPHANAKLSTTLPPHYGWEVGRAKTWLQDPNGLFSIQKCPTFCGFQGLSFWPIFLAGTPLSRSLLVLKVSDDANGARLGPQHGLHEPRGSMPMLWKWIGPWTMDHG